MAAIVGGPAPAAHARDGPIPAGWKRYAVKVEPTNPSDIARQLGELRRQHRELDAEIERCAANAEDEVLVKRMKKRKLWLKDCITRLESALIPDEPA
jgi:hypothetical protein